MGMTVPLHDLKIPKGLATKLRNAGVLDTAKLRVLTTRNLMTTFAMSDHALAQLNAALSLVGEPALTEPVAATKRLASPKMPGKCHKLVGDAPCNRGRYDNKMSCLWHWLLDQPIAVQVAQADQRKALAQLPLRPRVPEKQWPTGTRWCSGCQHFIPTFYCQGSRCHACASRAAHISMIGRTYDLTQQQYDDLLAWQGGRCYFCQRLPRSKRLAVDHDHASGLVRGLLCADDERGCNRAILGNIRSIAMARRIVAYLEKSPLQRVADHEPRPRLDNTRAPTDRFAGFLGQ